MRKEMEINKLKQEYNHNLIRFYNGISYLENHLEQFDKWISELLNIKERLNTILEEIMKYQKISNEEILNGFKEVNI